MGKKKSTKKKTKSSLIKQLSLIIGIFVVVIVLAVVIINAINKTTIKYITVEGAYSELYIGNPELGSTEVGISVYPETASKESLTAYSENPQVANVSFDGEKIKVEAVGVGTTNIIVRHSSKSSLYDSIQVAVKDVDVQGLTFVQENIDGELLPVTTVDIKKDGFKHYIPFDLDPINGNMNNLKVEDFNTAIFEDVHIDHENKCLVVVPKTDIVQTAAEIYVEVYQNTTEGYVPVQVISLQINLLNREAHIRFNLSSDPNEGYSLIEYSGNKTNNNNIVYLEQSSIASYVYVLPELGYDVNFNSTDVFNMAEYDLYFDGVKAENNAFVANEYSYLNKLKVSKANGGYYRFDALENFSEGDCIYVEFVHKFTGASSGLQFIYLTVESMGLDNNQKFELYSKNDLTLGEVLALEFSYDIGVEKGVVEIYAFDIEIVNGEQVVIETNTFGDELNDQTISIKKENNKLSLWTNNVTQGTTINFGFRCNYWDSRYVSLTEAAYIPVTFKVGHNTRGIHIESSGVETNLIQANKSEPVEISLVTEPQVQDIDETKVATTVTFGGILSSAISVDFIDGNVFEIIVDSSAVSGTYTVKFDYNGNKTTLFVVV